MADIEVKEKEYYTRLLTFVLGPATKTLHLYFEMKILNSLDFFMFLQKHRHILFHELHPTVPCCECKHDNIVSQRKKGHLNYTQFDLLFHFIDGQEVSEHQKKNGERITQHCLCNVSSKQSVREDDMDITLLYTIVKTCCPPGTVSGNPKWIKGIKNTRNHLAHCSSPKISESEFEQSFENTKQCVLNIASVVGRQVLKMIKDQITFFKTSDISTVREFIKNSSDTIQQVLEPIMKEQTQTLTEATEKIIVDQLRKHKEFSLDIRNITFEVKTEGKSEMASATKSKPELQPPRNADVCYVEWKLATPSHWHIDDIKKTLENVSSLIGQWFRIVFVYKGSLVIQTSAPKRIMQNVDEFQPAVKSFLKDVVEICELDTKTRTVIKVTVVVANEQFTRQIKDISTIPCDPCSSNKITTYALFYCCECQQSICQQCSSAHDLDESFAGHNFSRISHRESYQTTCSKHPSCTFDFFCVDHDCLCCRLCLAQQHSSCNKSVPLEDAAKNVIRSHMFQDFSHALSNIKATLGKAITSQVENIKNIEGDGEYILKQIKIKKAEVIKRVDELENEIEEETLSVKKKKKAKSEYNKTILSQIASQIKYMSVQWEQIFKHGTEKQIFVMLNTLKLRLVDHESSLQDIIPTLEKNQIKLLPPEAAQILGSIELKSSLCHMDYKSPKIQQVQIPKKPKMFSFVRMIQINHPRNGIFSSMVTSDDHRLLICVTNRTFLLVFNDRCDYLQDCELTSFPKDIAIIPGKNKAVVTLPYKNAIQFIDTETMRASSTHSLPSKCHGVTTVNQQICVCSVDIKNLYILDQQGGHIKTVKIPGTGYIHYLHPGPDNSVYYIDFTFNGVCCVTLEGVERLRHTSNDLRDPRAVITDRQGNLYVACKGKSNIQRLTSDGKLLDVVLDERNNINRPFGMTFRKDYHKLFVLNEIGSKYCVLVFSCS